MRLSCGLGLLCGAALAAQASGQPSPFPLAANVTTTELQYAASLGAAQPFTAEIGQFGSARYKWRGIALATSVDLLFAPPFGATAVLVVNPRTLAVDASVASLGGFPSAGNKWEGIAYAPSVDRLYAPPYNAGSVLVIDPRTNTTDTISVAPNSEAWSGIAYAASVDLLFAAPKVIDTVLVINPRTNATSAIALNTPRDGASKWVGLIYVDAVDLLYGCPDGAPAVLVVNPRTNATDNSTLGGLGTGIDKWRGFTYVSSVGLLFAAPYHADTVLMVNPHTNATDHTTIGGFGSGPKWRGTAFAPPVNLVFAAPHANDSVLIIDPRTNTTRTLPGLEILGGAKWLGLTFVPSTNSLFSAPEAASAVLAIEFAVDSRVITPLRQITNLTNQVVDLQSAILSTQQSANGAISTSESAGISSQLSSQAQLSSINSALSASIVAQTSLQAELTTVDRGVCNRPVCEQGTRAENGTCVPDCVDLARRGLSCSQHCPAPPLPTPETGGGGATHSPIGLIIGVVLGLLLVIGVGVVLYRWRSGARERLASGGDLPKPHIPAMYINPLHQRPVAEGENEYSVPAAPEQPLATVALDSQMYVAASDTGDTAAGDYAVFRSDGSGGGRGAAGGQYQIFNDPKPASLSDATA